MISKYTSKPGPVHEAGTPSPLLCCRPAQLPRRCVLAAQQTTANCEGGSHILLFMLYPDMGIGLYQGAGCLQSGGEWISSLELEEHISALACVRHACIVAQVANYIFTVHLIKGVGKQRPQDSLGDIKDRATVDLEWVHQV